MVLKIIGIVIGAILGLLALVLALPVDLLVSYSEEGGVAAALRILFWKYPFREKPSAKPQKPGNEPPKPPRSVGGKARQTADTLRAAFRPAMWLICRVRILKFHLLAVCGGEDAAATAMDYGIVCAAVYPLVGWLKTASVKPKAMDVQVRCDFSGGASRFAVDGILRIRVWYVAIAALRFVINTGKQQKGEQDDAKKADEKK